MRPELAIVQTQPVQSVVAEIKGHIYDAKTLVGRANKHRVQASQKMLGLRKRIEAGEEGEVAWWQWFETQDICSRRDAEKLLAYGDKDPEAAYAKEREDNQRSVQKHRATSYASRSEEEKDNQDEQELIEEAFGIIQRLSDGGFDHLMALLTLYKDRGRK